MEGRFKKNSIKVLMAPTVIREDGEVQYEFKRTALLTMNLIKRNHQVALCIGKNSGYSIIENIKVYPAPIPCLLGMPKFMESIILSFKTNRDIQEKKKINSYEEYLHIQGVLEKTYFKQDIEAVRKAIRDFNPDIIYTDTRLSAIIAAKLEGVKVVTSYSSIKNKSYSNIQYINGLIEVLKELNICNIKCIQDIFNMADLKIVQSSYNVDPVNTDNTIFIEPIIQAQIKTYKSYRPKIKEFVKDTNKILISMDNTCITIRKVLKEVKLAIENSKYEAYIKTNQISTISQERFYVSRKINLNEHLDNTSIFINNGDFDNFMMGLNFKVPQIIYPGNDFIRKHDAHILDENKCGIYLENKQFTAKDIRESIDLIKESVFYRYNNHNVSKSIFSNGYGGAERLVNILEKIVFNSKEIRFK